jgi:hypothetical protein
MVSPTVNYSYSPDHGWTWIETYVSGRLYSDNDSYLVNGLQTLSQKPILRLEEHVAISPTPYGRRGMHTTTLAEKAHRRDRAGMANTLRIGGGMGLRLWRGADLGVNYEGVVVKPISEPYSQTVRLTVRQLW